MVRLALSWQPLLNHSSADAFLDVETALLKEFDRLLPRRPFEGLEVHGTFDVLKFAGSIHFDPNYWDRFKR